jgi:hypothetical protein
MNVLDSITEINYDTLSNKEKEEILEQTYSEIDSIGDSLVEFFVSVQRRVRDKSK